MRFGSVCSGIEAASVAFYPLGWEAAWLAEVDVAASQVLSHRLGATAPVFPLEGTEKVISRLKWGDQITNWGDMTRVAEMVRSGEAEAPDVLCGGTPCQSFSVAGARRGLADERGNLALSFIQLADAIDERRAAEGKEPCIVVFENVPGLLSSKDNAFGCFLGALAGEVLPLEPSGRKWTNAGVVLGPERAVAWRVGDAQYHGLAQRRRRIFVVASAREGFDPAAILFEFEGVRRDSPPSRETGQEVAGTLDARTDGGGGFPGSDGAAQYHVVPHGLGSGRPDGSSRLTWPAEIAPTLNAHFGDKQGLEDQHVNQGCPLFVPHPIQPVGAELYSIMPMNSGKDYKARKVEVAQPPMAGGPVGGNQGGDFVVQSVAFAQNSRDEVRLINGDGSIAGALAAQAGMKQQTYVAQSVAPKSYRLHAMNSSAMAGDGDAEAAFESDIARCLDTTGGFTAYQGGEVIVQSVALRGRDGGATAELGGEAAYALRAANGGGSDPYVLAPVLVTPFDTTQITSPSNYSAPKAGDPCHPLAAGAHPPAIAFSYKDYGADAVEDIAPTMRAMGHSGSHANADAQLAVCVTGAITHTLKADGFDASEDGTGRGQPIVVHGTQDPDVNIDFAHTLGRNSGQENALFGATMAVRRLMPIECHYLQGFPGDWCAVPTGPKGDKIAADGPQYKQLGNSWAVNHARWVGYRIAAWLAANPPRPVIEMEFDENLLMWALAA